MAYTPEPAVTKVACVKNCASNKRIQGGSTARISGKNLDSVTKVVFKGSGLKGAAKTAAVRAHSARAVLVGVPIDAETGPVQGRASGGVSVGYGTTGRDRIPWPDRGEGPCHGD